MHLHLRIKLSPASRTGGQGAPLWTTTSRCYNRRLSAGTVSECLPAERFRCCNEQTTMRHVCVSRSWPRCVSMARFRPLQAIRRRRYYLGYQGRGVAANSRSKWQLETLDAALKLVVMPMAALIMMRCVARVNAQAPVANVLTLFVSNDGRVSERTRG